METLQFFVDIPGEILTIQHLADTLTFKHHWPHDLHDLGYISKRFSFFLTENVC